MKIKIGIYAFTVISVLAILPFLVPETPEPVIISTYLPPDFTNIRFAIDNDEAVDADSNVDAVANIGTANDTYTAATTKNGVYQGIEEAQGSGYAAATDTQDFGDNITDTQSPTNVGTYSNSGLDMDSAPDTTMETLTEVDAGGAGLVVENEYSTSGKKAGSITFSSAVVPSGTGRAIYLTASAKTKNADDGKFISGVTWNGAAESFTNFGQIQSAESTNEIWFLLDPTATTDDVVVTYVDNNANWDHYAVGVHVLSGVDTAGTPHDTWSINNYATGVATPLAHIFTTVKDEYNLAIGTTTGSATQTLTENGEGDEIYNLAGSGLAAGASVDYFADDGTTTFSWTIGGTVADWTIAAISINPAAAVNYRFDREVGFTSVDWDDEDY